MRRADPRARALRLLVADVAILSADDQSQILGELSSEQLAALRPLLDEFNGHAAPVVNEPSGAGAYATSTLSPWLIERTGATPGLGHFQMTDHAQRTLATAARAIAPPAISHKAKSIGRWWQPGRQP